MQLPCHVAVVEDHAGLLADLVEFLELRGFSVRGFDSVESFFSVWPATHFDLLLLDVALPGVSGLDIAQRVRSNDAHNTTGVVMLTALDANDDQVLGFHAGADVYLSKRRWPGLLFLLCLLSMRMAMLVAMAASTHATPVLVSLIFATMTPQKTRFAGATWEP